MDIPQESEKQPGLWARLNPLEDCREQGILLNECPSFLMALMGLVTIGTMLATYFVGIRYAETELIAILVSVETIVLLIISRTTVESFSRVAEANRVKTEFISITSHQLRTPLTSLKWSLNLLLGERVGTLNEKQRSYLESIQTSGTRMIDLVNDLLNVSRIEQGRFGVRPEDIDVKAFVEELGQELQPIAQANNVTLTVSVAENIPNIKADEERIRMALQNLIDNAIKYSKKGGKVGVVAESIESDQYVQISVSDDGIGIPKDEQKRLFSKFFRAQNVLKRKTEGSGLGLFIVRSVIQLHGGMIDFTSKEGEGTTFRIKLPVKSRIRSEVLLAPSPGRAPTPSTLTLSKESQGKPKSNP